MDTVTQAVIDNAPAKQSAAHAKPTKQREVTEGEKVTTKNVTLRLAIIEREDGIFEVGITTKSGEVSEITYGATKGEAIRRGLKKNAARIGRNLKV